MYSQPPPLPPGAAQIWLAKGHVKHKLLWRRIWTLKKVPISADQNAEQKSHQKVRFMKQILRNINHNTYIYLTWIYLQLLVSIVIRWCMCIKNNPHLINWWQNHQFQNILEARCVHILRCRTTQVSRSGWHPSLWYDAMDVAAFYKL